MVVLDAITSIRASARELRGPARLNADQHKDKEESKNTVLVLLCIYRAVGFHVDSELNNYIMSEDYIGIMSYLEIQALTHSKLGVSVPK